jgi:hypothetical protein
MKNAKVSLIVEERMEARPKQRICHLVWVDACYEEQGQGESLALAQLEEIGFLLAEDKDSVTIGMEAPEPSMVERWRLTIPKIGIISMKVRDLNRIFSRTEEYLD